jgi:hypothetical protein
MVSWRGVFLTNLGNHRIRTLLYHINYERLNLFRIHVVLTTIAPVVMDRLKLQNSESKQGVYSISKLDKR